MSDKRYRLQVLITPELRKMLDRARDGRSVGPIVRCAIECYLEDDELAPKDFDYCYEE